MDTNTKLIGAPRPDSVNESSQRPIQIDTVQHVWGDAQRWTSQSISALCPKAGTMPECLSALPVVDVEVQHRIELG